MPAQGYPDTGFDKLPRRVRDRLISLRLSGSAWNVALVLLPRLLRPSANADKWGRCSQPWLADQAGLPEMTTRRAIKRLIEGGVIVVLQPGRGHGRTLYGPGPAVLNDHPKCSSAITPSDQERSPQVITSEHPTNSDVEERVREGELEEPSRTAVVVSIGRLQRRKHLQGVGARHSLPRHQVGLIDRLLDAFPTDMPIDDVEAVVETALITMRAEGHPCQTWASDWLWEEAQRGADAWRKRQPSGGWRTAAATRRGGPAELPDLIADRGTRTPRNQVEAFDAVR